MDSPTRILVVEDEEHIAEWLAAARTDEGVAAYMDRFVHGVSDYDDYLDRIGGTRKLGELRRIEHMRQPLKGDLP